MIGFHFFAFSGVIWRENQGGLFPLSPPSVLSGLSERDACETLKSQGKLFLRWESDFDQAPGCPWWHIIKDGNCSLAELSSNTRSKVRRGLRAYDCDILSLSLLLDEGYEVYRNAFSRYETHETEFSQSEFENALKALPEQTEFWGVREKGTGKLVAFSENYVESDVCFYSTIWFEPSALKKYSSYALFYEMNRYYLEERGFRYISDGARSLSHATQIHDFLESKFGFRKAHARLHVVYTPWLGTAVAIVYPLRKLIDKVPLGSFKKASILLKQEEIRRQCAEGAV